MRGRRGRALGAALGAVVGPGRARLVPHAAGLGAATACGERVTRLAVTPFTR
ncbi:hypothetical protein ACGFZA_24845 [Streptomyces sp. NPDC048211]|uniref:hypothetical protein n=1 Tax=Streptomyces sp. NPDC048211 TaxID=3365516 RepID=UPI00371A81DA